MLCFRFRAFLVFTALAALIGFAACDIDTPTPPEEPPPEEDTTPPEAPSGFAGVSGFSQVSLEWDAPDADDLDGYRVYRSESAFSSPDEAGRLGGGEAPMGSRTYRDTDVENGTTYYYRVAAVDESGNESALSASVEKTPFPDPPNEP